MEATKLPEDLAVSQHHEIIEHHRETGPAVMHIDAPIDESEVAIGWRSWLVVLVTMFGGMVLVFVVTGPASVIAFIIRDLGDPGLAGWIVQAPLLMQSVLCPLVGRVSDLLDRKYLICVQFAIAFVGSVVSANAKSMTALIGGGIMVGVGLSSLGIIASIPAEILPKKYRAISSGSSFMGGALGALIAQLAAGALTNVDRHSWRNVYWMQAAFCAATVLMTFAFYHPPKRSDSLKMSLKEFLWVLDPIGTFLFSGGAALVILALDWAGSHYAWSDAHVISPLVVGVCLLLTFGVYEWKGRSDGIVAHNMFNYGYNFPLSIFAAAVEGWIFFSAVNAVTPQVVLNLGWESTAWAIAVRQLSYQLPTILFSIVIVLYATKFKDVKSPLIFTFIIFLIVTICYATITPDENRAQLAFNVLSGIGQSGPLTLVLTLIQFAVPHSMLATASSFAVSARALGGAFGSAVVNAIINGKLAATLVDEVGTAAVEAGLPASSVPQLLAAFAVGDGFAAIPGLNNNILAQALTARTWAYARAYRLGWASIIPFVALATLGIFAMKSVEGLMTHEVEASIEKQEARATRDEKFELV